MKMGPEDGEDEISKLKDQSKSLIPKGSKLFHVKKHPDQKMTIDAQQNKSRPAPSRVQIYPSSKKDSDEHDACSSQ